MTRPPEDQIEAGSGPRKYAEQPDGTWAESPMSFKERFDAYKVLKISPDIPNDVGWLNWLLFAWGLDIFIGQVPMLKLMLAMNLLLWWLLT